MQASLRASLRNRRTNRTPQPRLPKRPVAGPAIGQNKATPIERIRVAKDFRVELLYSVPAEKEGSWVNLCLDNRGRIIASDQYGGLYRFAPPAAGQPLLESAIEKVPAEIRAVNGMVWAFDALYVVVNDYESQMECGLYRLTDADGDDRLEKVELLRPMQARGDHGVHALIPTPDGKSLYWITGNGAKRTNYTSTRVPPVWGEDQLLPRMPDGRGFMRDVLGPGGIVYRVSPDGKDCEIVSVGYRNIFDAALNREGELFTYDADMEYDFNTSWYRPTRVCHVTSGSEYGWRNGAGKRPEWYPDNLPPVINIGPGSPTGMTFGYGAKFPAKYQEACFILDWSWGKLYAVHLRPSGSTYTAVKEEFVSGTPLPVTDAIINPADGAMYFAIGGRRVQSGLYRVTYVGQESTAPVKPVPDAGEADRALRHRLEAFHSHQDPQAVSEAWPYLSHPDQFIRWAARTAIEFQPPKTWADRALNEPNPAAKLEALLALVRVTEIDPQHRQPTDPPNDKALQSTILAALAKLDWSSLSEEDRIKLVRIYEISFVRGGPPEGVLAQQHHRATRSALPVAVVSVELGAVRNARLFASSRHGGQGRGPVGQFPFAGRADRIRPLAANAQGRLDAAPADFVLQLVLQGGQLSRRSQLRQVRGVHSHGCPGHAQRQREGVAGRPVGQNAAAQEPPGRHGRVVQGAHAAELDAR